MRIALEACWRHFRSADPLDTGMALLTTEWAKSLDKDKLCEQDWSRHVEAQALSSLDSMWSLGFFNKSRFQRLAFREFGATLGLQVNSLAKNSVWEERVTGVHKFWADTLLDHDYDITPVMYASSLLPGIHMVPQDH